MLVWGEEGLAKRLRQCLKLRIFHVVSILMDVSFQKRLFLIQMISKFRGVNQDHWAA